MRWLAAALFSFPALTLSQSLSLEDTEVSLFTIGPGKIYWQAFGHNAITVADPVSGFNAIYNFGIFDFTSENFLLNFVMGKMSYRVMAFDPDADIAGYIRDERTVTKQVLNLNAEQKRKLIEYLDWHSKPENASYRYDYFLQNCSTKVRDALDIALDGALKASSEKTMTSETFRSSLGSYSNAVAWLHLGANIALGRPVDNQISLWSSFYLPDQLSEAVATFATESGAALAQERIEIYEGSAANTSLLPLIFLAIGVLCLWLVHRNSWARSIWSLVSGLAGVILLLIWLLTEHWATAWNPALIALSPLLLALPFCTGKARKALTFTVIISAVFALFFVRSYVQVLIVSFQITALVLAYRAATQSKPAVPPSG
ncbi:MAG: DUF4105 domain-containing protein [Pseudomonadota bacterium]